MNISQVVRDELIRQLEQCQQDINNLSDSIAVLQVLLLRRQEDEDKLAQVIQLLRPEKQVEF